MKIFVELEKFLGFANENFFGLKKFLGFAYDDLGFINENVLGLEISWGFLISGSLFLPRFFSKFIRKKRESLLKSAKSLNASISLVKKAGEQLWPVVRQN